MAREFKFLDAYVEISTRGDDKVLAAIRAINEAAKNGVGGVDVPVKETGAKDVQAKLNSLRGDINVLVSAVASLSSGFANAGKTANSLSDSFSRMGREAKASAIDVNTALGIGSSYAQYIRSTITSGVASIHRVGLRGGVSPEEHEAIDRGIGSPTPVSRSQARKPPQEEKQQTTWERFMYEMGLFGSGTTPRRGFAGLASVGLEEMFGKAFSSSVVGNAISGTFGTVFGGIALQFGYTIAQAIMKTFETIGNEGEMRAGYYGGLLDGVGGVNLKGEYAKIESEQRDFWKWYPGGWEEKAKALQLAQNRGIDPGTAKRMLPRIGTLALGSGEGEFNNLWGAWVEAHRTLDEGAISTLESHPMVEQALMNRFGLTKQQLARQKGKGLGLGNALEAIDDALLDQSNGVSFANRMQNSMGPGTLSGFGRGFWSDAKTAMYTAFHSPNLPMMAQSLNSGSLSARDLMTTLSFASPAAYLMRSAMTPTSPQMLDAAGVESSGGAARFKPNPNMPTQYQFSSFSGLANMMQMQALGGRTLESDIEKNTRETAEATKAMADKSRGVSSGVNPVSSPGFTDVAVPFTSWLGY